MIDKSSILPQVMAWHSTGDMPLSEPMMIQLTDVNMWQQALVRHDALVAITGTNILAPYR